MIAQLIASLLAFPPVIGAAYMRRDSGTFDEYIYTPIEISGKFVKYESRYFKNKSGVMLSTDFSQFAWTYTRRSNTIPGKNDG